MQRLTPFVILAALSVTPYLGICSPVPSMSPSSTSTTCTIFSPVCLLLNYIENGVHLRSLNLLPTKWTVIEMELWNDLLVFRSVVIAVDMFHQSLMTFFSSSRISFKYILSCLEYVLTVLQFTVLSSIPISLKHCGIHNKKQDTISCKKLKQSLVIRHLFIIKWIYFG